MASRIVNLSNGHRIKFSQALRLIEQCAIEWVQYGVSVRKLEVSEMVAARSKQAEREEPLAEPENRGQRFDPPISGIESTRRGRALVYETYLVSSGRLCWLTQRPEGIAA